MRAPVWVRGVVAGVLYGAGMFGWSQLRSNPTPLSVSIVFGVLGGAMFGLMMGVVIRRQERRIFRVGSRVLDGDQRVAARRALVDGRPPDDPLVRDAAVDLARFQFRRANGPIPVIVLVSVFSVLAGWLAVARQPLWWFGVVCWIGMGAVMLYGRRRSRRRADRLLQAVDEATEHPR